MINMTFAKAATLLNTKTLHPHLVFNGLSLDSRTLQPGNLFVAIPGERVDGHDFVQMAMEKGAAGALVSHAVQPALPVLMVPEVVTALGLLAKSWRDQFSLPIIAVTGSNGKTTLKNMIAAILRAASAQHEEQVLATQGNHNNHLGLPLTLARLNTAHRYAVIEMGMNHFGEIEYLTQLTRPTVAVITNAASAHLAGVGSIEGVARAKAEIFSGLDAAGTAILNRDDMFFSYWQKYIKTQPYLTFGFHPHADVHMIEADSIHTIQPLKITTPHGQMTIKLPLLGKHNVLNALAAIAATMAIHIEPEAIIRGLEHVQPAPGRLQLYNLANGVKIIDDTYNANPFSLQAAITTLTTFAGKKILVLGDMKELGEDAQVLHQQAGEQARKAGVDYLFTYGDLSAFCAMSFGHHAYHFHDHAHLMVAIKPHLADPTTTILVKGSRAMHMEKVVAELVN